ncbi:MAG: EF-hand domain-containing protein [Candidatus Sumerlaeaceae bacterium]
MPTTITRLHPKAQQFRDHQSRADTNRDGFVTRQELWAEMSKAERPRQHLERVLQHMMESIDLDGDSKLSRTEIADGVLQTHDKAVTEENVARAKELAVAIDDYQDSHDGQMPKSLEQLVKLGMADQVALSSTLADGQQHPWIYKPNASGNAVVVISPGRVNAQHQYIVVLGNGNVFGIEDDSQAALDKIAGPMNLFPVDRGADTSAPLKKSKP